MSRRAVPVEMLPRERPGPAPDAPNDTPVLRTSRLELSFGRPEDADVLFPFVHGEEGRAVTDTLLWDGPDHPDELRAYFRGGGTQTFGSGGYHWLVRDRDGSITGEPGRAIGSIGIRPAGRPGAGDIGYWLAPPYWNRGLMAEAVAALVTHSFDHWGCTVVTADVFTFNPAGRRLLEKLGFRRVGEQAGRHTKRGEPVDCYLYEILPGQLRVD